MTAGDEDEPGGDDLSDEETTRSASGSTCSEPGCARRAAVRLYIPWDEDRSVCPAHARVLARPDGVVAEPIKGTEAEWP